MIHWGCIFGAAVLGVLAGVAGYRVGYRSGIELRRERLQYLHGRDLL